jgi:spore coat protein U-like protein
VSYPQAATNASKMAFWKSSTELQREQHTNIRNGTKQGPETVTYELYSHQSNETEWHLTTFSKMRPCKEAGET